MASYIEALSSLAAAQKSRTGVSLYSRWINRPLGRVFAGAAYVVGVSPNAVTAMSALFTGLGLAILVLTPLSVGSGVAVAGLLVLGFALDSADGQVARLSGHSSAGGEWLDHVVDAGKMVLVHTAVLLAAWRFWDGSAYWLLVPLGYQTIAVIMFSGGTLVELLERNRGVPAVRRHPSLLRAIALLPADYGVLAVGFVLWGTPVFRFWYAGLTAVNGAICCALLIKWFRKLTR